MVQLTVTYFTGHQWSARHPWGYLAQNVILPVPQRHVWPGMDWHDVRKDRLLYKKMRGLITAQQPSPILKEMAPMRITDLTTSKSLPTCKTTDVPLNQVFRGTIVARRAGRWTGVFFKAQGGWRLHPGDGGTHHDNVIVRLDGPPNAGFANVSLGTSVIENYEPLDAQLVLSRP